MVMLACFGMLVGCATVPETGRRALYLLPESQMQVMAADQFTTMVSEQEIVQDGDMPVRVATIGKRVAAVSAPRVAVAEWEFVVFADDAVNAFAMPGGKVGFYAGLLDFAESDDELAMVMGHEIAHVNLRHGNERMSQALALAAVALGAQIAAKDEDRHVQEAILLALGVGSQLGVLLPYSRIHEKEADRIGLLYAARAGYDPRAAVAFWERMNSMQDSGHIPEFLSTHPSYANRIEELHRWMPDALDAYRLKRKGGSGGAGGQD